MKIRTGFVSNSSTASFVIIGFTVPRGKFTDRFFLEHLYGRSNLDQMSEDDLEDDFNDTRWNNRVTVRNHEEEGAPKKETLIGVVVAEIHDDGDYADEKAIDVEDLLEEAAEVRNKLNLSEKEAPIKMYIGTRMA